MQFLCSVKSNLPHNVFSFLGVRKQIKDPQELRHFRQFLSSVSLLDEMTEQDRLSCPVFL